MVIKRVMGEVALGSEIKKKKKPKSDPLSRRERQIMDVVYRMGEATVGEVVEALENPPSYSTIRTLMGTMEKKGYLSHRQDGTKYIYLPEVPKEEARKSALSRVVESFFGGSATKAAVALLEMSGKQPDEEELSELRRLIEEAEGEGR